MRAVCEFIMCCWTFWYQQCVK